MDKKTIMLCCAAGMSTSILVKKMQDAVAKQGLDYEIFACPASEADVKLQSQQIDCVLLGPQVRYMLDDFQKKLADTNIPVEVIDMVAYGMMDGQKVLNQAAATMAR
jgi:PTS system cellobiose-specific IIB component